jgi:L,D-peptidoglycan transpeptidase YkuD (ErfK/YbiS/YcfS/YnhG family)
VTYVAFHPVCSQYLLRADQLFQITRAFLRDWRRGEMKKLKHVRRDAPTRQVTKVIVRKRAIPGSPHLARLHVGFVAISAAIGKSGVSHRKREGDGASPAGAFRLERAFFRNDRVPRIATLANLRPLKRCAGWSDDTGSHRYNRPIQAGAKESHEKLWREDRVYDVIIPTSHNQRPRVLGAGSAIFLHLARPGYAPTEGCVAISLPDLRRLLPRLGRKAQLVISG